jgi:hypothetical protein
MNFHPGKNELICEPSFRVRGHEGSPASRQVAGAIAQGLMRNGRGAYSGGWPLASTMRSIVWLQVEQVKICRS